MKPERFWNEYKNAEKGGNVEKTSLVVSDAPSNVEPSQNKEKMCLYVCEVSILLAFSFLIFDIVNWPS